MWRSSPQECCQLVSPSRVSCTVACSSGSRQQVARNWGKYLAMCNVAARGPGLQLEFNNRAHGSNKINGRKLGTGTEMKERCRDAARWCMFSPGYWCFDKRWKGSLRAVKIFVFASWFSQQGKRNWNINWNTWLLDSHLLSKKSYGKKYIFIRNIYVQSTFL